MTITHQFHGEPTADHQGISWHCPDCGRHIITHRTQGMTIINAGDQHARHSGTHTPPGLTITPPA